MNWRVLVDARRRAALAAATAAGLLLLGTGGTAAVATLVNHQLARSAAAAKHPSHPELDIAKPAVPQQLVIRYRPGVSDADVRALHNQYHLTRQAYIPQLGVESVQVPAGIDPKSVARQLGSSRAVTATEPNYILHAADLPYTPNDTYFATALATSHDGTVAQWGLPKISAGLAWKTFRGPGSTTIAVLDTGVDPNHPDLAGRVLPGFNFVDNNSDITDDHGHGTMVAGLAAAISDNSAGVASVSFNSAQIMPVKVLDRMGNGSEVNVASGITFAADGGAKVINLSLGGAFYTQTIQDAVDYAWSKGAVVIAAAGNNGSSSPEYPAGDSHVVGVAATDQSDAPAGFSSYGSWVSVSAPGVAVVSTMPTYGTYMTSSLGYFQSYDAFDGTSASAPMVSGLAALLISQQNGNISNAQVVQELEQGADFVQGNTAWNPHMGWGRLNASNVINQAWKSATTGGFRGQVVDGSGAPISGAVVTASAGSTSFTTGADGEYLLTGLPKDSNPYTLSVNNGGVIYKSAPVNMATGADVFVDITAGPKPPAPTQIQNGGFETGDFSHWALSGSGPRATISSVQVHTGSSSALLGASSGREGAGETNIGQPVQLQIPSGMTRATLSFWYWTGSSDLPPFDLQGAQVRDAGGNFLAWIFQGTFNDRTWRQQTFDLTPYSNQTIQVLFKVRQDGRDDLTWMYVDDVTVTYS